MPNISERALGQYDVQYTAEDYMELQESQIKQLKQERDEVQKKHDALLDIHNAEMDTMRQVARQLKQERDDLRVQLARLSDATTTEVDISKPKPPSIKDWEQKLGTTYFPEEIVNRIREALFAAEAERDDLRVQLEAARSRIDYQGERIRYYEDLYPQLVAERDEARRWAKKYKRWFKTVNKLAEEYLTELYRLQPGRKMDFVDTYQELSAGLTHMSDDSRMVDTG